MTTPKKKSPRSLKVVKGAAAVATTTPALAGTVTQVPSDEDRMLFEFVIDRERRALVSAWPHVKTRRPESAMYRDWFDCAGLEDCYRIRTWSRSLLKLEICREDGTVHPDIAKSIGDRATESVSKNR